MPVLAIDAGGSSSRALAASLAGLPLAGARGGPAGAAGPPAALAQTLSDLLGRLGPTVLTGDAWSVIAGFSGAGRPQGSRAAEAALRRALAAQGLGVEALTVTTDAQLALLAVDPRSRRPAAVLVAGTGSIALAGVPGGAPARAGGWGPLLGDEGGGFWLGWRALEAVGRYQDGRQARAGALARAALAALGLTDADALVLAAPGLLGAPARVASLAPLVLGLAAAGDPAAVALVAQAGRGLAGILLRAREAAGLDPAAPSGLAGGLWAADQPGQAWGGPLHPALLRALPAPVAAGCRPLAVPPVVGAACSLLPPEAAAALAAACGRGGPWAAELA